MKEPRQMIDSIMNSWTEIAHSTLIKKNVFFQTFFLLSHKMTQHGPNFAPVIKYQ